MNSKDLKKLLTGIEICNSEGLTFCERCPFKSKEYGECSKKKFDLAKKLLQEMEQEEKTSAPEHTAIRFNFDNQITSAVVHEWLGNGRDMVVGYKPDETYRYWIVGHIVTIDLTEVRMVIRGIDTGDLIDFSLVHDILLTKWHGGPSAKLICTKAIYGYKPGCIYNICDGKMNPLMLTGMNGRFETLEDEFLKEYFILYKGDVLDNKQEKYLNGWLVCKHTETHLAITAGYRYRITSGCFVDDRGIHHNHFTSSAIDMDTLENIWHMIYIPDKK